MSYCSSLASSLVKAEANWGLWSNTTFLYSLNCLKTWLKKNWAIPMVSMVLVQGVRVFEGKEDDSWNCRMSEDLVCLADCTARNIFPDIGGKARPPVILGKEGDGAKMTTMAAFKGAVGGSDQIMAGQFRDIETSCIIELSIIEGPIFGS